MAISIDAMNLIAREEVSDAAYYNKMYQHFDWPQGASGPTVGIGYDCGYCSPTEIETDWAGILTPDQIDALTKASGIRGAKAASWVKAHKTSITITFKQAVTEFVSRELVKWERTVTKALPNCWDLSPDSLGALVSLAYNRGASFNLPGARYAEMRAIKSHMQSHAFNEIPNEILSMRRLWPNSSGLRKRREHEAILFTKGLR